MTGRLQQNVEKIEGIKINTSTVKCLVIHIDIINDVWYKSNWVDKSEKKNEKFFWNMEKKEKLQFLVEQK